MEESLKEVGTNFITHYKTILENYASKYGYVLYHRILMENHLGRILNQNEVVHHIDGTSLTTLWINT